jgi:hypothetical protein
VVFKSLVSADITRVHDSNSTTSLINGFGVSSAPDGVEKSKNKFEGLEQAESDTISFDMVNVKAQSMNQANLAKTLMALRVIKVN